MESKSVKAVLKAVPRSLPMRFLLIAVAPLFVLLLVGNHTGLSLKPDTAASQTSTLADNRFHTPQATAAHWMQSVNKQDWRQEYDCYTGMQQAKFTYQVMLSTRELSDSQDLSISLRQILQRFRFPLSLLDEFPSQRLDLSDPNEKQAAIDGQAEKRRVQLARWKREVQPLQIDWARMMAELQPLLMESHQRHLRDMHPSTTGIAHHLAYHFFERTSNLKAYGNRAQGTIVGIVRDPDVMSGEGARLRESGGLETIRAFMDRTCQNLSILERRVKRAPESIFLVREAEGWKIDSVPFR